MPTRPVPATIDLPGFHRLTTEQYRKMVDAGILVCGEPVELLEGLLVNQPRPVPPRVSGSRARLNRVFLGLSLPGWCYHPVAVVTMADSGPEPDFAVVRGHEDTHRNRFPGPEEVGIVGEVSASSLAFDRRDKGRIYSRAGIPVYWILNVEDRQIEVYTNPDVAANPPAYTTRTDYAITDAVPVVLDGATVATIPVADLIP